MRWSELLGSVPLLACTFVLWPPTVSVYSVERTFVRIFVCVPFLVFNATDHVVQDFSDNSICIVLVDRRTVRAFRDVVFVDLWDRHLRSRLPSSSERSITRGVLFWFGMMEKSRTCVLICHEVISIRDRNVRANGRDYSALQARCLRFRHVRLHCIGLHLNL
jgi:hypothetical protein